jgi:hypothetical protein
MAREIISKEELLDLLREEASKHEACKGNYIGPIREKSDESGCNWVLEIYLKNKNKECLECMRPLIARLRKKFNIHESQLITQQQISELSKEEFEARFERGGDA